MGHVHSLLDGFYANFGLLREKHKHLICMCIQYNVKFIVTKIERWSETCLLDHHCVPLEWTALLEKDAAHYSITH